VNQCCFAAASYEVYQRMGLKCEMLRKQANLLIPY
jgi:hypothetical protein